jgi:K(+)-stimulated pyrophosphate-energized sodium pump
MQQIISNIPLTCALIGVIGILYSLVVAMVIKGKPAGTEKMQQIAAAIQEGAIAYLKRQAKSMGIVGIVIFGVIFFSLGPKTAIGFAVGAIASFMAGYIGMRVSVVANVRVAEAAKDGLAAGLSLAFKGGLLPVCWLRVWH